MKWSEMMYQCERSIVHPIPNLFLTAPQLVQSYRV